VVADRDRAGPPLHDGQPAPVRRTGLDRNGLLHTVAGIAIVQCAKAWFLDRMVLLFEDLKTTHSEYAAWEY